MRRKPQRGIPVIVPKFETRIVRGGRVLKNDVGRPVLMGRRQEPTMSAAAETTIGPKRTTVVSAVWSGLGPIWSVGRVVAMEVVAIVVICARRGTSLNRCIAVR